MSDTGHVPTGGLTEPTLATTGAEPSPLGATPPGGEQPARDPFGTDSSQGQNQVYAQGYDAQGYEPQGYDAQGYESQGFPAQGYDQAQAPVRPAYTFLDQPDGLDEEDEDELLMPGPAGSWSEPAQRETPAEAYAPAPPPPAGEPIPPSWPTLTPPAPAPVPVAEAPAPAPAPAPAAPTPEPEPAPEPVVRNPVAPVAEQAPPQPAVAAPRRPLHAGPPIPDPSLMTGQVPVRSLADRGPSAHGDSPFTVPAPPTPPYGVPSAGTAQHPGPEYLDQPSGAGSALRTAVEPAQITEAEPAPPQAPQPAAAEAPMSPTVPLQMPSPESTLGANAAAAAPLATPAVAPEPEPVAAAPAPEPVVAEPAPEPAPVPVVEPVAEPVVEAAPQAEAAIPAQSAPHDAGSSRISAFMAPPMPQRFTLPEEPVALVAPVAEVEAPVPAAVLPVAETVPDAPAAAAAAPVQQPAAPEAPVLEQPVLEQPEEEPQVGEAQSFEPEQTSLGTGQLTVPAEPHSPAPEAEPEAAAQPEAEPEAELQPAPQPQPQPEPDAPERRVLVVDGSGTAAEAQVLPEPLPESEPLAVPVPQPVREPSVQPVAEPPAESFPAVADSPEAVEIPGPRTDPAPAYDDEMREAVHRVMRERRDIRNGFRPDPIPHEVLIRVLEAAHTAPSVGYSQPWDFVVIRSAKTRARMHELAERQREAYAASLPKGRAKQFKELKIEAIVETPVNIVVTADRTRGGRHTLGRHTQPQMAPYSAALAVENLWLAARAEGLGVGWVSFFDEQEMIRELGLPEHLDVVAYLCVGYVNEFPTEPELAQAGWAKKRPLSWVVHEETYGRRALPGEEPHSVLQETLRGIRPLDAKALGEAWDRQKRMTKPAGSLGMLEIISAQLCGLSRKCPPPIPEPACVAVFAGDHGVHAQGVTHWPQEVTAQMVANFLSGGAVVNAFAAQVGAEVCVVDVGVATELPPAIDSGRTTGLLPRKIRLGTADMTVEPAMTREEALRAVEVGIETARDLVAAGNKALVTGDMGIANTTAAAALICVFTGEDPAVVTGRGTGIDDETHARKISVIRTALDLHRPDAADPIGVLAAVGGLEHAALAGFMLGAASLRTPVILDGVAAGAAALVAKAIAPEVLAACVAGHRSAEPGHKAALAKLGLRPLIDLDLRLGEGTGALLALPLVQSAARAMHDVATFDSAGVTEKH
ncbi:nicotinate-nucleotide--dimethylbenzimidazole phosphoribosyltransferase [Streptacidiphilus sp. N1-12]|uniref:Nicotinate-nucleotide--dimethylbenzimidazole phosphoribosyltransferase n=2 Tax=Streptacidiphilus alkalitolerans TaxID=3342712 RepID=A0ABV6W709_9ACTN